MIWRDFMFFDKGNVLKTFESLPEIIEEYFKNIPEEFLDKKRSKDSWTIREHLYHIAKVQEMLYQRILKIKNEENPVITPYFPDNEKELDSPFSSIEKAFSYYKEMRKKQITLINTLTGDDFGKEAKHEEYARYNIPIIINHMIFHEYWHVYRIEDIWLTRDEFFS
jgi:uncharacterized damage-inducible protein DinB